MNVLHVSNNGFPDTRVERAARTAKKDGHVVSFAGPYVDKAHSVNIFDLSFELPFNKLSNSAIPFYWGVLRRKLSEVINDFNPDIIHAHNVVAAKLASETGIPFIYDDHEYWSKRCKIFANIWNPNKLYLKWLWTRWEDEVLRKAKAIVAVNEMMAKEHRNRNKKVFVVPNFPSIEETEYLKPNFDTAYRLSSVYIGNDFSLLQEGKNLAHRNVDEIIDFFNQNDVGSFVIVGDDRLPSSVNVNSLGFLRHDKMMRELTKHHIGLLPWKKHWYHKYCDPNKPYEYAHSGLLVVAASDFLNVKNNLGNYCILYDDLNELRNILSYYGNNLEELHSLKKKIRIFAIKNLTWEKRCEKNILKAYEIM